MVQRVNFLERGRFAFTYQNAAILSGLVLLCCLCIHGALVLQGVWAKTKVIAAKEMLKGLSAEFEKQVQLAQASKSEERTGTAILSLASVFERLPRWARVLSEIAAALPDQVWLTAIKSTTAPAGGIVRQLEIEGQAHSIEAINHFVERLGESPGFANVVNPRSTKEMSGRGFIFSIGAEVTIAQ